MRRDPIVELYERGGAFSPMVVLLLLAVPAGGGRGRDGIRLLLGMEELLLLHERIRSDLRDWK